MLANQYGTLGEGEGRSHTDKLYRFKLSDGTPCVCEVAYPNVWMRHRDYLRNRPRFVAAIAQVRAKDGRRSGFHSNVLSTVGFEDEVMISIKADSGGARDEVRSYLATFK